LILITGANGHLGRRLVDALVPAEPVRAVVRSERAAALLRRPGVDVRIVDYLDEEALTEALEGCVAAVHLVGIVRETATSTFVEAHEATTRVLVRAARAAGVERILYLSILGAAEGVANPCLASKGRAERLLLESDLSTLILRVPMVLGEGDYASSALARRARAPFSLALRAASLEQPIYAGDVIDALVAGLAQRGSARIVELAGPESLSRRALIERAAGLLGRRTRVISLPLWLGLGVAWVLERLMANPPVSGALLGVLDHDDRIDATDAARALSVSLTSLDEMLSRCLVESPSG
jgi:uncharacterized protein YbjT (DUF2867 family)